MLILLVFSEILRDSENLVESNKKVITTLQGHHYLTLGTVSAQYERIDFAMKNQYKGYSSR